MVVKMGGCYASSIEWVEASDAAKSPAKATERNYLAPNAIVLRNPEVGDG